MPKRLVDHSAQRNTVLSATFSDDTRTMNPDAFDACNSVADSLFSRLLKSPSTFLGMRVRGVDPAVFLFPQVTVQIPGHLRHFPAMLLAFQAGIDGQSHLRSVGPLSASHL
ncbi:hypothetical protein RF11_01821 [Thelohanellus kitauei]|uniref:Uncharacterized protein n=1 Tax=Thelohanellus kitauei TaxID=669202 RepID=A0A0C2JUH3_THEKT|nr:hypothetical protein RF11_01821 [Thelohanellus kitauei]